MILYLISVLTKRHFFIFSRSHIQYFWEAVHQLDKDERAQLINFCSGRSRLPAAASDFHMSFKLTAPPPRSEKEPDDYLPIARTCFFSLSLPKYSSVKVYISAFFRLRALIYTVYWKSPFLIFIVHIALVFSSSDS